MKLNKGLRLIAIGFLFTLINLNITTQNHVINFTPDFVGWILICAGLGNMKNETGSSTLYQIVAIILAVASLGLWVAKLVFPKYDLSIYQSAAGLVSTLFIFALLSLLEKIARKYHSTHSNDLKILKFVYLIVYILFQATSLTGQLLPIKVVMVVATIVALGALITAIATAIILFKLSFELDRDIEE